MCVRHNSFLLIYITFSINCVLESMRKSLKTVCKQLSVALVSRIRLSNCFSISCVFESILWEKSWRNRKSCNKQKWQLKKQLWRQQLQSYFHCTKAEHISHESLQLLSRFWNILPSCLGLDGDGLLLSWPFQSLGGSFWLTPESAAKDQLALLCRISSRVQGLSQISASFSRFWLLLGPFVIPSGNPLICNQSTCCY